MENNKFKLTEEQKKLCHEITMEVIRQNSTLKFVKDENGKHKRGYEQIRKSYFLIYEEIAIGIYENWDSIQEMYKE